MKGKGKSEMKKEDPAPKGRMVSEGSAGDDRTPGDNITKESEDKAVKKGGGKVEGKEGKKHAGRKPRKAGGRAEGNPFTSAASGTKPKGHMMKMN